MFDVVLSGPEGPRPVGTPVPIEVIVRNRGVREIWLVGVLDGSEEGVRYPHYRPRISRQEVGPDGVTSVLVAQPPPAEDPLVAALRLAHFHRLAAEEAFDPMGAGYHRLATFQTYRPPRPGVYRYTLTLSTESDRPEQWLGVFGQDAERAAVLDLVARLPRGTVTSAPLDIEIR